MGEPLVNNRQNLYAYDGFSEQFNYTDPKEMADAIAELAADPVKLQQLGDTNTETFETHFTPLAVVRQIMNRLEQELPVKEKSVEA